MKATINRYHIITMLGEILGSYDNLEAARCSYSEILSDRAICAFIIDSNGIAI